MLYSRDNLQIVVCMAFIFGQIWVNNKSYQNAKVMLVFLHDKK